MGKAKLKKILDARSGRNVALEKQRKQEKAAEKRKAQNAPEVEDEEEVGGVPLDEVEVKVNGKAKDSKNSKKAAKATEKEAEWETDGSEDEDDSEDDEEERPAFDLSRLDDSESDVSGDDDEDEEEDEDDDEEAEDIPLSDIESLASEDKGDIIPHQRLTINNTAALTAALKRIELPYSKLAFSEYQSVTTTEPVEIADIDDDLNRELAFYKQCLSSVKDARGRLKKEGVSFSRPADYFAEMVKSDEHMGKIKAKLIDEAAGKKASAEARKQRDLKKFGKQVQVAKMQERAKEKRDTIEQINLLKRKRQGADITKTNEEDLFDIGLEADDSKPDRREKRAGGDNKRHKKNEKFGFGGKKRHAKSNTAESTNDGRGYSAKKMKGAAKARPGKARRMNKH
jgi:rRNA-processing protein EBP2